MDAASLGTLLGGGSTACVAVGAWFATRSERKEKRRREWLVQDEILGHKDVPGVPDKRPMSTRLATLEIGMQDVRRELHPNGGSSLADTITQTHRLAERAADHAKLVADSLEADKKAERAQEVLIRSYVMANPEQFPELFRIIQMFPLPEKV